MGYLLLGKFYCANEIHCLCSKAARREDTLLRMNAEKKAVWRAEAETELEAAAMKTQ